MVLNPKDKALIGRIKKHYKVKIIFENELFEGAYGLCDYRNSTIRLSNKKFKKDRGMLFPVIFHEIGHIYCYRNGIWKGYHSPIRLEDMNQKQKKLVIQTGLKAERWVDLWGYVEMQEWTKRPKYHFAYNNSKGIKWYKDKYLSLFR